MNSMIENTNQNKNHPDDVSFDDLAAAGADARTIAVARALAAARCEAPARLVGVRWAAAAEADGASEVARDMDRAPVIPPTGVQRRLPAAEGRRAHRWWPQLVVGAVGVVLVALLWVWVVPWLSATTIRRPEGRGEERPVPKGPDIGQWTIVDQIGGPIGSFVIDGERLVAGRGAHIEAYDLADVDPSGQPRLVARSPLLPARPDLLAVLEGTVYAVLEGQPGLLVFDPSPPPIGPSSRSAQNIALSRWRVIHSEATIDGLAVDLGVQPKRLVVSEVVDGRQGLSDLIVLELALGRESMVDVKDNGCCASACTFLAKGAAHGGHVYCSDNFGIRFLDLTDLANAHVSGELSGVGYGRSVSVDGGRIYVSHIPMAVGLVEAYDIANPAMPERLGFYSSRQERTIVPFTVTGGRMAVTVLDDDDRRRLDIVDVRNMGQPRLLWSLPVGDHYPAFALGEDHLAVAIQTANGGQQFDVFDLPQLDHDARGTTLPSSSPQAVHIESPTVEGMQAWGNGALVLSSLGIVGAPLRWPPSQVSAAADGTPASHVDSASRVFGGVGEQAPSDAAAPAHNVLVQATGGDTAAALLVREAGHNAVEVGLVAWSLGEPAPTLGADGPELGPRIAWARYDVDLIWGTLEDPFVRAGWHLVVDDQQAVAFNADQPGDVRLLVFDLTDPSRPRLVSDARAALTDPYRSRYAAVIGGRIIVGGGHRLAAFERQTRKKLRRIAEWTISGAHGNGIAGLTATNRGLLVVEQEKIGLWPLDQAGLPDPLRVKTLATTASLYPRDPTSLHLSLAVDGDLAYTIGWSSNSFPSMLREINLVTGEITALLDLPPTYSDGDIGIAAAGNRVYVHHPAWGLYIIERRP